MIHYKQQTNDIAKIYIDSILVGYISNLKAFYEVSVLYHDFKIKRAYRAYINECIKTSYETTQYLLEAERLKLPIRINRSLDKVPSGNKNLTILA